MSLAAEGSGLRGRLAARMAKVGGEEDFCPRLLRNRPPLPSEGILRTNPVYTLTLYSASVPGDFKTILEDFQKEEVERSAAAKTLIAQKLQVAPAASEALDTQPGVVRLVFVPPDGPGFVTPLKAELADQWRTAPNLPFREPEMRVCLARLLQAWGNEFADLHPEFFTFRIADQAG